MFKSELIVKRDVSNDNAWIVQEPLVWEDDKYEIKVLRGFDFDFASIPKIITNILPKNGQEYDRAACLHDALYASRWLPKAECDRLFYDAMIEDGVSKVRAWSMYQAVKWFGHSAYKDGDEAETVKYKMLTVAGKKG